MTITEIAIEPTKSPAGPGNSTMGVKASAVVTVEARRGTASLSMELPTAASLARPFSRAFRISSVMTIAASTRRPSATMRPVTDI